MDINYWYLAASILTLVYVIPVLVIRSGIDRRKDSRRMGDRRMAVVTVGIDRRSEFTERRQSSRRG